ncbi:hypothetical protein [Streptomyces sp. NPDC052721]|uniref:hypothetical protein n=1 Tax=Streptomyces sp. NPDC052721 TaxID=3154955 RepID=UPI00343E551D
MPSPAQAAEITVTGTYQNRAAICARLARDGTLTLCGSVPDESVQRALLETARIRESPT